MADDALSSLSEAGRTLGVHRYTIRDLVARLGIIPKPMSNNRAKGLDRGDLAKIAKTLGPDRRKSTRAS